MIKKEEFWNIILAIFVMSIAISFFNIQNILTKSGLIYNLKIFIYSATIIFSAVIAKKLTAKNLDIEIEHKILGLRRYWFYKKSKLTNPIPIGVIFPLLISVITSGYTKIFTLLQFDSKETSAKITKRYGSAFKRFSKISEWEPSHIAFCGLITTLLLAVIASTIGEADLAKYSIYYAIANLFPFGQLDGMKILLGSEPIETNGVIYIPSPLFLFSIVLTIIASLIVLI